MSGKRARSWCFTINNHNIDDLIGLVDMSFMYLVFGFEIAPSTGTPHIQGYVAYDEGLSRRQVSKLMPRASVEVANGSLQSNYNYCSKGGDFYVFGEKNQGKRTDLDELVACINRGETVSYIRERYPKMYFMYKKRIDEMVVKDVQEKERHLVLLDYDQRYSIKGAFISGEQGGDECYLGEKKLVAARYGFDIEAWLNGFPPRVKRGYEIVSIDPDTVYLVYKDTIEELEYKKKYSGYIDEQAIRVQKREEGYNSAYDE